MKRIPILSLLLIMSAAALLTAQEMPADRAQMDALIGEDLAVPAAETYSLTVEQAVDLALENNLSLVGEEADLRIKKRARDTAWNVLIPSVTASSTLSRFDEPTSPSFGAPEVNGSLSASMNFSLTLTPQLWYGFRSTEIDYQLGRISKAQAEQDIRTNVKKQFYALLTQEEQIKILELQQRSLEKRFDQASTNYDFGLVDEYTKLSAQVALENFKPQVEIARDGYEQSLLGFKLSLGVNLDSQLDLQGSIDVDLKPYDADQLSDAYLLDRLDIQNLVTNLQSLENLRRVNINGLVPSLTFGYGLSQSFQPDPWEEFSLSGDDWEPGNSDKVFSITLSLSLSELLPVSRSMNSIKDTADQKEALRANLQQALEGAELEILTAVQNINKSIQVIRAKELNVELAERAYDLAEESYNAGGRSLLEVEDAEDNLQEARFELLSEKVNYINGLIDLEAAINRSIEEIE